MWSWGVASTCSIFDVSVATWLVRCQTSIISFGLRESSSIVSPPISLGLQRTVTTELGCVCAPLAGMFLPILVSSGPYRVGMVSLRGPAL